MSTPTCYAKTECEIQAEMFPQTVLRDEPINIALRDHQVAADWDVRHLISVLHGWAGRFNVKFKLDVPVPALVVDRLRPTTFGHFLPGRNPWGLNYEIAVQKEHALQGPFWEVLGTVLHEMLHLWQDVHGTPPKSNYHNREYRQKASSLGLIVDRGGHTRYAPAPSPFFDLLMALGIDTPALPAVAEQAIVAVRPGFSKLKLWQCKCPVRVRVAKPNFRARCLECGCIFQLQNQTDTRVNSIAGSETPISENKIQ